VTLTHEQPDVMAVAPEQIPAQDRQFMLYMLTQVGDARLSKIETRLDALEKAHPDTTSHDSITTVLLYVILASLLFLVTMTSHNNNNNGDSPPRIDFKSIIKAFLRPVLFWLLDQPDEEKHVG
jgi:hypothetical protein